MRLATVAEFINDKTCTLEIHGNWDGFSRRRGTISFISLHAASSSRHEELSPRAKLALFGFALLNPSFTSFYLVEPDAIRGGLHRHSARNSRLGTVHIVLGDSSVARAARALSFASGNVNRALHARADVISIDVTS